MSNRHPSNRSPWRFVNWRLFQYRFVVLLCMLTLLLIATPILHTIGLVSNPGVVRAVMAGLFGTTLLAAVFTVSARPATQIVAILLGVPAIVLQVVNVLMERDGIAIPSHLFSVVLLGYAASVLLSYLFSTDRVNGNTVCVSLCVYLLLGVFWAVVYSLLEIMEPGSFSLPMEQADVLVRFGGEHSVVPLCYSYATMTTLGGGDIAPMSSTSRMFAAIEAATGQIYLAMLIARLVGLHLSQSISRSA